MRKMIPALMLMAAPLVCFASPPSFALTDTAGRQHTLETYRGKWVLVNFWATWCAPCLSEMPELEALSKSRSDLVVLGLAADGQSPQRVRAFAEGLHVSYPVVAGGRDIAEKFKVRGYPTTILYNPAGKEVFVKEGKITREEINAVLQSPRLLTADQSGAASTGSSD